VLPERSPDVIYQALSEGAVLFLPADETYFGLNDVGVQIWERLAPTCKTLDELCGALGELHSDVEPEVLRADIVELLDELHGFGLIVNWKGGASLGAPPTR
jgi:hypothetical protein